MSVLSISLPDDVREWVEQEAAASGASVDDFFSRLAREAKARKQQERELRYVIPPSVPAAAPAAPAPAPAAATPAPAASAAVVPVPVKTE